MGFTCAVGICHEFYAFSSRQAIHKDRGAHFEDTRNIRYPFDNCFPKGALVRGTFFKKEE